MKTFDSGRFVQRLSTRRRFSLINRSCNLLACYTRARRLSLTLSLCLQRSFDGLQAVLYDINHFVGDVWCFG